MSKLRHRQGSRLIAAAIGLFLLIACGLLFYGQTRLRSVFARFSTIDAWFAEPEAYTAWQINAGERCGSAPMLLPTTGFIGVGWNDGLPPLYQHSGFDIFGPDGRDGVTPVFAAYDGYLYRGPDWRSAVIIRHPNFPHLPDITGGEQIWTYYTHMASRDGRDSFIAADFPPGTSEQFVTAGTLLGYQGSWSGSTERQMRRHLHFSVVKSNEDGSFMNETRISNTLDPMPFLGLSLQGRGILTC